MCALLHMKKETHVKSTSWWCESSSNTTVYAQSGAMSLFPAGSFLFLQHVQMKILMQQVPFVLRVISLCII